MKTTIVCENHLSLMVKRLETEDAGVIVRSLLYLPYMRRRKCQYKPCGMDAYFGLGHN